MHKKKVCFSLILLIFIMHMQQVFTLAAYEKEKIYTVYENSFDSGRQSVLPADADGYTAQNEFMDFDGILGQPLQDAQVEGNMGVRIKKEAWMEERTFLFDFTKGGTKTGIYSGIWCMEFDFSMDPTSTADYVILGINMENAYSGQRMLYFYNNGSIGALEKCGDWGKQDAKENKKLDFDTVYHLKTVINFDEGTASYYLDDTLIGIQTNLKNITMNDYAISLSGLLDYFDNLKITASYPYIVENFMISEKFGNIFYEDEPVILKLKSINRYDKPVEELITIEITDSDNHMVWSKQKQIVIPARGETESLVYPSISKFEIYLVKVTSEHSREVTTRISKSVQSQALNKKVGVCGHFDGRHDLDVSGMFDLMAAAGLGHLRTDWGCKLNEDGTPYCYESDGGYFEDTIREAKEHGIQILAILSAGTNAADGGFHTDEEAVEAYRDYCRQLAKRLSGRVERFELGNEDNYRKRCAKQSDIGVNKLVLSSGRTLVDLQYVYVYQGEDYNHPTKYLLRDVSCIIEEKKNSNGTIYGALSVQDKLTGEMLLQDTAAYVFESGVNYYTILQAGYDGIKQGNPNALVATSGSQVVYTDPDGTLNRNQREFAQGILETAQRNSNYCFDAYAVHPYHNVQPPEFVDQWIMNTTWSQQAVVLDELFAAYSVPQEKQKWATEFGYSARDSALEGASARQKTAWIMRTLLLNEINGCYDTIYLYDMMDDGLSATNAEHNFGTICYCKNETWYNVTAYAAKPQYLALAQYNKMLAEANFVKNAITADVYTAEFRRGEDTVFAIWNPKNTETSVTISGRGNCVKVYDMYGNMINNVQGAEQITVTAYEEPIYVEFLNCKTEIRFLEDKAEVIIVNDTETAIEPVVLVAVSDKNGFLSRVDMYNTYRIGEEEISSIDSGQIASVSIDTDYSDLQVKIMVWKSIESMIPMCRARIKQ